MAGLGEQLRAARQQIGLSLTEAAAQTGVRSDFLAALENENYHELPTKHDAQAALAAYTKLLGLDPLTAAGELRRSWASPGSAKAYIRQSFAQRRRSTFNAARLLAACLAVLAIVLATGIIRHNRVQAPDPYSGEQSAPAAPAEEQPPEQGTINRPDAPAEEPSAPVPEDNGAEGDGNAMPPAPAEQAKVTLEISTTRGDCWLDVIVDGKRLVYRTVARGEATLAFEGYEAIEVVFGNAAAVDVIHNQEPLGTLGAAGQVVRRTFYPA